MRVTEGGITWESIEDYLEQSARDLKNEDTSLQQTVDAVFSDFVAKIRNNDFEYSASSEHVVPTLNKSNEFKQLACDILMAADVPEENIGMLVTMMAHFVLAGHLIRESEVQSRHLASLLSPCLN